MQGLEPGLPIAEHKCFSHLLSKTYLRVGNLTNPVRVGVPLDDDLIHILNDLQSHQHVFTD